MLNVCEECLALQNHNQAGHTLAQFMNVGIALDLLINPKLVTHMYFLLCLGLSRFIPNYL